MLEQAFELRFDVYCRECAFLPEEGHPDGRETDEHDVRSAHFGVFDAQDQLVGYVRLVRPESGLFPFQRYCKAWDDASLPRPEDAVEVSRLMVRRDRRKGPGRITLCDGSSHSAPGAPAVSAQILLHLYRQIFHYSRQNGVRYLYAAMERSLARSLGRFGLVFQQIGPLADYYGPVAPYLADLCRLETDVAAHDSDLLAWMTAPMTAATERHVAGSDWRCEESRPAGVPSRYPRVDARERAAPRDGRL